MRKMFRYPPLFLVLNLVLGILLSKYYQIDLEKLFYVLVCSGIFIFFGIILKKTRPVSSVIEGVLFFAITVVIGAFAFSVTDVRNTAHYYGGQLQEGELANLTIEIQESLRENKTFKRFVATVIEINSREARGTIIVNFKKDSLKPLQTGGLYVMETALVSIKTPRNPHEFDYAEYLANQQIYHQIYTESNKTYVIHNHSVSFLVHLERFRARLIEKLQKKGIKSEELSVISALLLGERDYLSSELRAAYIDAGAIHILAISGLHIGILFLLLSFLLKGFHRFPCGKVTAQFIIVAIMWLFAMLAGLSPSVVRAVTMFTFVSIGLFLNRRNSVYHSLIGSAFVLLLLHPRFLFEVGFQLSYTAVLFIVWLQPKLQKLWKPKFKIFNYFWQLLTVSCAAQLGVLPLSLYYFNQFPSLFFLSNLVIVPTLGVVLGVGLVLLFCVEFDSSPDFLIQYYAGVIRLLNEFITGIAGYESFVVKQIFWPIGLLLASYLVLLTFFKFTEHKSPRRFGMAFVSILCFYGILFYEATQLRKQGETVIMHNSRGTIITQLNGEKLQVFGGAEAQVSDVVENYITAKGVSEIRYHKTLPNLVIFKNQPILLIDSLGLYNYTSLINPVVLLRNSPRINMERMIEQLCPSLVIADGSNYRSSIKKWERSALKLKTPFHDTSEKGAFLLK